LAGTAGLHCAGPAVCRRAWPVLSWGASESQDRPGRSPLRRADGETGWDLRAFPAFHPGRRPHEPAGRRRSRSQTDSRRSTAARCTGTGARGVPSGRSRRHEPTRTDLDRGNPGGGGDQGLPGTGAALGPGKRDDVDWLHSSEGKEQIEGMDPSFSEGRRYGGAFVRSCFVKIKREGAVAELDEGETLWADYSPGNVKEKVSCCVA